MNKEKVIQYVLIGLALVIALVGSYFGVDLPHPEIPDVAPLEQQVGTLQEQVDALKVSVDGPASLDFGVGIPADVFRALRVETTLQVDGVSTLSGGVVGDITGDITGDVTGDVTGDLTGNVTGNVTGDLSGDITSNTTITGNATLSGTLTLESVAFSGPVRFGSASDVVTGTQIAHGLGITPTAASVTPVYDGVLTNTVYILSMDTTTITIGMGYTEGVTTVTSLMWMAGK